MSRPAAVSKIALKVAKALNPKSVHNEQRRAMSLKIEKTKKFDNRIITTNRPLLGHEQSQFATEFRKQRKEAWNKMVKEAVDRETNFATGQANVVEKSKLPPVYPFTPHAVNPYTGNYVVRPGTRTEGVIDLDTTLSSQILDYKRRIVNSRNKFRNTDLVVGDASVHQSRIDSNTERMNVLFDDTMRPFLNRRTRVSPIYHDTTLERRMPRTPLPADTVTGLSPTAGVLHAYRMHWVRMYLADKKSRKVWEKNIPFENVYNFDSTLPPVTDAANQAGLQEFMHFCKGVAAARNSNFVPRDTVAFLGGIKKMLPTLAKVNTVEVVKVRRRKK